MANNLIQIKRSTTTAIPGSLANGELAITSNGDVLYVGSNGAVLPVGGKRVPGTLTANQALVANSTSGIDKLITANLTTQELWANGSAGTGGWVLRSGGAGSNLYWATMPTSVAGSDTQVQFNDGGSLAGDAGLTFDKTTDTLSAGKLAVVNTTASSNTTTGAATVAGGLGVAGRINTGDLAAGNDSVYSSINGTSVSTVNVLATGTVNGSILSVGTSVIGNSSGVYTTGSVNGSVIGVGTQFSVNTTQVSISQGMKLSANGSLGSASQVLKSDAAGTAYWADETGDISSVTAGSGLTGGGTSGDVTLSVQAGNNQVISNASGVFVNSATFAIASSQLTTDVALGTQTSGNYVATITAGSGISGSSSSEGGTPTIAVVANNGIVSNSSGVFAKAANGISVDASGINVVGSNGIISNTSGVFLQTGSTLTVNATGLHVNNTLSITDMTVSGNLTVLGDLVSLNVATLAIEDPLIVLAKDQSNTSSYTDAVDIGFYGSYGNTQAANKKWTGLFRDQSDSGIFKLFDGAIPEPTTTIDTTNVNFSYATLQGYLKAGGTDATGLIANSIAVNITANSTMSVAIVANTLSLSTALPATSGGTGQATYSVGDLLVGNSTNTLTKLSAGSDGYVLQINGTGVVAWGSLDGGTF